ncbi:alanine racemase [Shigella flexneri]
MRPPNAPRRHAFGVARLQEALPTACGGITKPVWLLEGFFDARYLPTHSAKHFHTAVHNEEQLAALEEASLDEPVTVWMKLDTGMHRLGVRPEQAEAFSSSPDPVQKRSSAGEIVSHFARADQPKCGQTQKQLVIFKTLSAKANLLTFHCRVGWGSAVATVRI